MVREWSWVASIALVGVLATGCGGSTGSTAGERSGSKPSGRGSGAAAGKVDVCAVVTAADAATVVGGPAEPATASGAEPGTSGLCIYKAHSTELAVPVLQVRVYRGPQFYGESIFPNRRTLRVKGASRAFLSVRTAPGGATRTYDIQFVKGGRTGYLNYVDTKGADRATVVAALSAIARKLAAAIRP